MKKNTEIITASAVNIYDLPDDPVEAISLMAHAMNRASQGIVLLALEIGDVLRKEKASRPHGTFLPWLNENIERMGLGSTRTAREYMKLSENRPIIEQQTGIDSLRSAFRILAQHGQASRSLQKSSAKAAAPPPVNPRSRRGFAIEHVPDGLGISKDRLKAILQWYESKELTDEFRAAIGSAKPKAKKPAARISAVVKPKAKRELERRAKRVDMTQGQLIEQLLQFADQVESHIKSNSDGGAGK